MNWRVSMILAGLLACLWGQTAQAAHVTLSGEFDGSEALLAPLPGTCAGAGMLQYQQAGSFRVSVTGAYSVSDPSNNFPGDIVIAIYAGSFDPNDASANRVATVDDGAPVNLASDLDHVVVVQRWCDNDVPAVYAVAISGPGDITGEGVVASPAYTLGVLTGTEPQANFGGTTHYYELLGPVQVPHSGLFWFADVSVFDRVDVQVLVYEDAFDPSDVTENLVGQADDAGTFTLQSGRIYWFVVIPFFQGQFGEWHWVLFPPGPLQFNAGLNGAWFNAATAGQGLLMDVFTELQLVFLAWFTFDLEAADGSVTPMIGGAGQRWFTALGSYVEGDRVVSLDMENTTGGAFDSPEPAVGQDSNYGTIELEFSDCLNGLLTYDIPVGPVSGAIPLTRVANDHFSLCAVLGATGPGVITE